MAGMMRRVNGTGAGGAARGVALAALLGVACPLSTGVAARDAVVIEHATLQTFPEANCTKVHLYLKNTGAKPAFVNGIHFNGRYLDLVVGEDLNDILAEVAGTPAAGAQEYSAKPPDRGAGALQWYRCLPNPIEAGSISDVTVSLWGAVKEADVRVALQGGATLSWQGRDEKPALRLSHIAFDPAGEKIYVYCENKTDKPIRAERLFVNGIQFTDFVSIPTGGTIEPGGKSCLILRPEKWPGWGKYVGVSVVGTGSEKAIAVTRVLNLFPIGEWRGSDLRPEMYHDCVDLRASQGATPFGASENGHCAPGTAYGLLLDIEAQTGRDWGRTAGIVTGRMAALYRDDVSRPCFTNICNPPQREAMGFFGGLTDYLGVNAYQTRSQGPFANASAITALRRYADPHPVFPCAEAYTLSAYWGCEVSGAFRNMTSDEMRFSVWSEIAAGCKGVRYYVSSIAKGGVGYRDVPGAEAAVAHTNLELQLLKPFLRLGDTFSGASVDDGAGLQCHALLCGDKGLVIIVLNRQFRWSADRPTMWVPSPGGNLTISVPVGLTVSRAYELVQGWRVIDARHGAGVVHVAVPRTDLQRVFLLASDPAPADVRSRVPVASSPSSRLTGGTAEGDYAAYATVRQAISLPVHDGATATDCVRSLQVGAALFDARSDLMIRLAAHEQDALPPDVAQSKDECLPVVRAYLRTDALSELREAFTRMTRDRPGRNGLGFALAAVDAACATGQYGLAAELCEVALRCNLGNDDRLLFLDRLPEIWGRRLGDHETALKWAHLALDASGEVTSASVRARLRLGEALLAAGRPMEAVTVVETAASISGSNAQLDLLLGTAYECAGRHQQAEDRLRSASRCPEVTDEALFRLGIMLIRQQRYSEALHGLARVAQANSQSDRRADAIGIVKRLQMGRRATAPDLVR